MGDLNTFYAYFEASSPSTNVSTASTIARATEVGDQTSEDCPLSVSEDDIRSALRQVNSRKAAGPDGIIHQRLHLLISAQLIRPLSVHLSTQQEYCQCYLPRPVFHPLHLDSNKGNYARLLFIDFSLAFNAIVPLRIVTKLRGLGLSSSLCSWV